MSEQILVTARAVGQRRRLLEDWSIPYGPELGGQGGEPLTLRELITQVVIEGVQAFKKRQQSRRFVRVLSARQIEEGAERGKIEAGGSDLDQEVEEYAAVGAALQAFEDGIYLVIVDGQEQKELDREVFLQADSHITFLRLVMLAGG